VTTAYPRRSYAWIVVAILIATAVLSYTDRQVLSLLVDPIRGDLGISDTQISLLLGTAFAVVYGVAGIPLGFLADRTSRRNLIVAGVFVWSLGTISCGLSHTFGEIFASRIVVGLGEAALSPAAISLISDYFPPSRRGTAVGFFLSGIAMGNGAAILIGGGVLHVIEVGALAGTPLAMQAPWRMVLLAIGCPGLVWALVIFLIREPARRAAQIATTEVGVGVRAVEAETEFGAEAEFVAGTEVEAAAKAAVGAWRATAWARVIPLYLMLAAASFVDNAVGAWAPTLLIRDFGRDPAQVGVELGMLLTAGFGGGVLLGGVLADRAGARGGWPRKLRVCLLSGLLTLPASLLMNSPIYTFVLAGVPLYFALSGIVTAIGFSAILDMVPNRSRGLAMSVSFFLNVALGAGLGPTAVALAASHVFGPTVGLGPPLVSTVVSGYLVALAAIWAALFSSTLRSSAT
jgi:MFS family permease